MEFVRCGHAICSIDYVVYVFGGFDGSGVRTCEEFKNDSWRRLPDLEEPKEKCGCTKLRDMIYIAGYSSNKVEAYDHASDSIFDIGISLPHSNFNTIITNDGSMKLILFQGSNCTEVNLEKGETGKYCDLESTVSSLWWTP